MVKVTSYKIGDKVFAKVKGYPPWPAQIVGDTGKKKYNVLFYGTQETGAIKPEDLSYYLKYKNSYVHKYTKRAGYEDAVKQIEEDIKKDGGDGNDTSNIDDSQDIEMSDASSVSSVSEKRAPKRKITSLPNDLTPTKKTPAKGRRKSIAIVDSKDNQEESATKGPRRKSNASTDENSEELAAKKNRKNSNASIDENSGEPSAKKARKNSSASTESKDEGEAKKSSDNGIKEDSLQPVTEETTNELQKVTEENNKKSEPETTPSVVEEPVSANESEQTEEARKEDVEQVQEPNKEKEKGAIKKTEPEAKEPESVEINNSVEETMQIEEEPPTVAKKPATKGAVKVEIVTEQLLNNNILYAEHVKKHLSLYTDKPVEPRQTTKDEVLAVKLPSGTICGVKLHKEWPLNHANEHDRALYDEKVAKLALEAKDLLSSGKSAPDNVEVIPDIEMTLEDVKEITYARDIESKRKRLDRLKKEADLVTWDSKIKNNLGLDQALPEAALECLKEFRNLENDLDALAFKKHPHVFDTVRRLRKYVGNMKEWDMSDQDIENFTKKAEKIRNEAEEIYNKIKNVFNIEVEKGLFWDSFMDLVAEFRTKCKDLTESECLVLCAEPDSRQAFFDRLDEVTESEGTNINLSNTSEPVLKETSVQGWSEKK